MKDDETMIGNKVVAVDVAFPLNRTVDIPIPATESSLV